MRGSLWRLKGPEDVAQCGGTVYVDKSNVFYPKGDPVSLNIKTKIPVGWPVSWRNLPARP